MNKFNDQVSLIDLWYPENRTKYLKINSMLSINKDNIFSINCVLHE